MVTRSEADGVRIFLLGGFRVCVGPHAIDDAAWRLRKARSLIKLLALTPGHRMHREQLVTLLWPDLLPEAAANNLHQVMHLARRALEMDPSNGDGHVGLTIRDQVVVLDPSRPLWVDVEAFEEAAERALRASSANALEDAIRLYTGELLPDDRYEDWIAARRDELAQTYLRLLLVLAGLYGQDGKKTEAMDLLCKAIALEPAHESAHASLMRLHAVTGQREAALRQFHDLQTALKDIDADPQPATVELHKLILSGDLAKLGSPPSRHSRGAERRHTRPLRRVEPAKPERPGNLPAPLATFVGRDRELTLLKDLLAETRLLTLTGPGGAGKTRLGLEFAAAVRDRFPDGVWWIDLQALREATQVAQTVAATLGVREQPGRLLETLLAGWLRGRRLLLVLDNCEHLLAGCAALTESLLGACPQLQMLTTSRERLGVSGETRWPVPPLAVPPKDSRVPLEELRTFEAIRLFEIRSRAVKPGFTLTDSNAAIVAEVCRRLDGLPLAIELAAARTHVLSTEQILNRLNDASALLATSGKPTARYSTLTGAIDWSYRLLSESERALFVRLAVFAGGFTLEAAHAVCAIAPVESARTLDLLTSLVDKSLVTVEEQPEGVRYGLLETIREYAREKFVSSTDEMEIRDRHLSWCLELTAAFEEPEGIQVLSQNTKEAVLASISHEHQNIRAAVEWSQLGGNADKGLRLTYSMLPFWVKRGRFSEGREWLDSIVRCSGHSSLLRARGLRVLGRLTWIQGETAAAALLLEEALTGLCEAGNQYEIARCRWYLGSVARTLGEYSKARALYEESAATFRGLDAKAALGPLLGALALVQVAEADYGAAEASARESLAIGREAGDVSTLMDTLETAAEVHLLLGQYAVARPLFEEELDLARGSNSPLYIGIVLAGLGALAKDEGDLPKARSLLEEVLRLFRETGFGRAVPGALRQLAGVARMQNRLEEAASLTESALQENRAFGSKPGIALCLWEFAQIACKQGRHRRAACLFGAAEVLREEMGTAIVPADRTAYERDVSTVQMDLGEEAFAQAWAAGRAMMMDEAVSYALCSGQEAEEPRKRASTTHRLDTITR